MPEALRRGHGLEVDVAAGALVVAGVDDGVVGCGCLLVWRGGGRDVDASDGEGVLQHLHHRAVALSRLGGEEGAEVADVEEEFDLPAWRGGGEALREDVVAGAGGGGWELGGEVGEVGGAGVVREGEVGGGVADCGADAGLGGGVLRVGGGGEEGIGAQGLGGEDGGVELVDHHGHFGD